MGVSLGAAVTGGSTAVLTNPTHTWTADTAPSPNGEQYACTALGGTQTGVRTHTVSSPFTTTFFRPVKFQTLGKPNPVTGIIQNVPRNDYKVITRKGVIPLAGQPDQVMLIETRISVPAGAELNETTNVASAISAHCGALMNQSSNLVDLTYYGIL